MDSKIACVTGASAGIGEATAHELARLGYALILSGRRQERLEALAAQLSVPTKVLAFDIADRAAVQQAWESLSTEWQAIDVLVNNAGNAHGLDFFHEASVDDWEAMIDINVKGLLYLSRWVTPGMVQRKRGHVINLGSIAGKETYAKGTVYCASKAAVQAITDGMRIDLNPYGVKVTAIHPGMVETEFSLVRFKGDEARAQAVYQGLQPLTAADVAQVIGYALSLPPHVVLADVLLLPTAQASATVVNRTL